MARREDIERNISISLDEGGYRQGTQATQCNILARLEDVIDNSSPCNDHSIEVLPKINAAVGIYLGPSWSS